MSALISAAVRRFIASLLADSGSGRVGHKAAGAGAVARTVQDKLREVRSLTDWMSDALRAVVASGTYTTTDRADMLTALTAAWNAALAAGHDLYAPPGRYEIGDANFPWRNSGAGLLDCKNITIHGAGPASVFATYSPDGADAFQLNALKNLHFRNLKIAPVLTATAGSGSNAISITGGWDNLTFDGVIVENAPGVDKGTYIDGGKALSIQPGTTINECGTLMARIIARGCAEAFGMDADLVTMAGKRASITLDVTAEDCYRAFKYSAGGATAALSTAMTSGIVARVHAVNCQQDVALARVHGITLDAQIVTSKGTAARRLSPSGTAWAASDSIVEALWCQYAKNARLNIRGNKGACDYKARIGGATAGSSGLNGATEYCDIALDVTGTAATADVLEINSGGNTMRSSVLEVSDVTASSLPAAFYASTLKNRMRVGQVNSGTFTATLTGCTTAPTATVKWSLVDDVVTLELPALTATSNSTSAALTGMPDQIKPATAQSCIGISVDGGVSALALVQVGTAGTISLHKGTALTGFTASGTKGSAAATITYRRSA